MRYVPISLAAAVLIAFSGSAQNTATGETDGPTPLSSGESVADYNVTRLFGGAMSDVRTASRPKSAGRDDLGPDEHDRR